MSTLYNSKSTKHVNFLVLLENDKSMQRRPKKIGKPKFIHPLTNYTAAVGFLRLFVEHFGLS